MRVAALVALLALPMNAVLATEECEDLSLRSNFETSDVVAEVRPLSSRLNYEEFLAYSSSLQNDTRELGAWEAYEEEFPLDIVQVQYLYKGSVSIGSEIFIHGSSGDLTPGRPYIIFLEEAGDPKSGNLAVFTFNRCAVADLQDSSIVWGGWLKDRESYKPFMNQLMFMKRNARAPTAIPDVVGKKMIRSERVE